MNKQRTAKQPDSPTRHLLFSTPYGEMAVVYRPQPFAIKSIVLPRNDRKAFDNLVGAYGPSESGSHANAVDIKDRIVDYFNGKPVQPVWKWMDMSGLTQLQTAVLRATADIPYGELKSYKDIAIAIHRPRAYRFVGNTIAKNPFPILIPCHRVIRSDRSFGQFGGGTEMKRKLIETERYNAKSEIDNLFI